MPALGDGTVVQSGNQHQPGDYEHQRMYFPVLGIVLNVFFSDDRNNRDAVRRGDQRGSRAEAEVLVINDGGDTFWVIPHAVITPPGASGVDNYHEELPRPCTQMIDASTFDVTLSTIDPEKLDGDRCIVQFIGGSIDQPFISSWWPHPGNIVDPATNGNANSDLVQGRRLFKRYAGTKMTVTNKGSVFVDTNESGTQMQGSDKGVKRTKQDAGGDIQIDVKAKRQVELNWNPPVDIRDKEPSLPPAVDDNGQTLPNPPQVTGQTRTDTATRVTLTQDEIDLLAGKIVQLIARTDKMTLQAKKELHIESTDDKVTAKSKDKMTLDASELDLNGTDSAGVLDKLVDDVKQLVTDLQTILNGGTSGGPTKQQIVLATNLLTTPLATTAAAAYKSTKVKLGK